MKKLLVIFILITLLTLSLGLGLFAQKPDSIKRRVYGTEVMLGINAMDEYLESGIDSLQTGVINVNNYATGDGITDDKIAIQNALTAAFNDNKKLVIPAADYYISGPISVTNETNETKSIEIEGGGATFLTDLTTASSELLSINGGLNSYHDITQSVEKGTNWLVCPELIDSLSAGDLIKIFSTAKFNDTLYNYNEASGKGEMKVVRNVVDSFIYVSSPFFDSYSLNDWYDARDTAQNWKTPTVSVAKVNPVRVVIKNLNIKYLTDNYTDSLVTGAWFSFVKDSYIQINVENFADFGVTAYHSFNSVYDVNIYNTPRGTWKDGGGSPGYGFQLAGSSINNLIRGNIETARHCFAYNAGSGVGWGNVVTINGTAGRANPIIDSHSPNGSIYFTDCNLYGGEIVDIETSLVTTEPDTANDNISQGIVTGARYTYIKDCNFFNIPSTCISFRYESEVHECVIQNVSGTNCGTLLALYTNVINGSSVRSVVIDGVIGDFTNLFSGGAETCYTGKDLRVSNAYIANMEGSVIFDTDIENLYLSNCSFSGLNDPESFYIEHIDNIYIDNVTWKHWDNEVMFIIDADNIYLTNCIFDSTSTEIIEFFDSDGTIGTFPDVDTLCSNIYVNGCKFINTVGSEAKGILQLPDYTKINDFQFANNIVDYHYHTLKGTEVGADRFYVGANQMQSYAVQEWDYTIKHYGNSPLQDISAGNGTPEGSVVGNIGSMYLREDGSTGTTLYIKESGTGNTGWVAK